MGTGYFWLAEVQKNHVPFFYLFVTEVDGVSQESKFRGSSVLGLHLGHELARRPRTPGIGQLPG